MIFTQLCISRHQFILRTSESEYIAVEGKCILNEVIIITDYFLYSSDLCGVLESSIVNSRVTELGGIEIQFENGNLLHICNSSLEYESFCIFVNGIHNVG